MHIIKPARTETVHVRSHSFSEEGHVEHLVNKKVILSDHADGLVIRVSEHESLRETLLTWEMLYDFGSQIAEDLPPHFECLNCGEDFGTELPFPELEPLDSCEEHSTAEGEGLVVRKGDTHIKVWIWATVHRDVNVLGYRWFFSEEKADDYITSFNDGILVAHVLEPVLIPLKQDDYMIGTKIDLEAAIDRYWHDNREDFLLKMVVTPH